MPISQYVANLVRASTIVQALSYLRSICLTNADSGITFLAKYEDDSAGLALQVCSSLL
jgi:hypothetical protein